VGPWHFRSETVSFGQFGSQPRESSDWARTTFATQGRQAGSLRYGRLGNLRYSAVSFDTLSSCAHYNMGFGGNCFAANTNVTGVDRK